MAAEETRTWWVYQHQQPLVIPLRAPHCARYCNKWKRSRRLLMLFAAANSDLVAAEPRFLAEAAQALLPIHIFPLPMSVEPVHISQAWHSRFDADPAHRWLRECVSAACKRIQPSLEYVLPHSGILCARTTNLLGAEPTKLNG